MWLILIDSNLGEVDWNKKFSTFLKSLVEETTNYAFYGILSG